MREVPLLSLTCDSSPEDATQRLVEETFGLVYWANTVVGHATSLASQLVDSSWVETFQQLLFAAGEDIDHATCCITAMDITWMATMRKDWEGELAPNHGFILPGGAPAATRWQEAAAILMQARRLFARLARLAPVNGRIAAFLDEAAFLCFVQGRRINWQSRYHEIPVDKPSWLE